MARRSRCRMPAALAAVTAAHALAVLWLALFQPTLRFRAGPDLERRALIVSLAQLPTAVPAPGPVRPPVAGLPILPILPVAAPEPAPAPDPAPIADADGEVLPSLARPVFRIWPHPLPPGVDWGSAPGLGCADRQDQEQTAPVAREHAREPQVREPRCLTG
jgi:hypothetical protein